MEDAKYLDLMAKYLSGNLAESEREQLFSWVERDARNRTFFDEIIQLWSISGEYEEDVFEPDTEMAWGKFEKRLQAPSSKTRNDISENGHIRPIRVEGPSSTKVVRLSGKTPWLRYAAVLLLLVGAGLWWYSDPLNWWTTAYLTDAGETTNVQLPDGSEVTLNANTSLEYREWWGRRQVYMSGEAFFDVERLEEKPFEILSGQARTVVLGTAFNVRAYPEEERIEVTVERGTVRVEERKPARETTHEAVVLEAGRSAVLDEQSSELKETSRGLPNATAWKTGMLKFDDVPMDQVITTLERVYKVNIEVDNGAILLCPFYSTFENKPLDAVMQQIDVTFEEIQVRQLPGGAYRLIGEGCME